MAEDSLLGIAAALTSALSWAIGSVLFARHAERLSPMALTFAKGALSIVLLGIVLAVVGTEAVAGGFLWLLVLSGLLGIAVGDTCFFAALKDLGPVALLVLLTAGQVLTVVMAMVFLHERPPLEALAGVALVIAGIVLVLRAELAQHTPTTTGRGVAFGIAFMLCMSVSVIIAKPALETTPTLQATVIRMAAGTIGVLVVGLAGRQLRGWTEPFREWHFCTLFLASVIIITFGGFWLSIVAIKYLDVTIANTLNSTEPIFVLPLAALLLKQRIAGGQIIGAVSAVGGVALILLSG